MRISVVSWVVFATAAVLFLAIKMSAVGYSASDENTYYKMGELVARGQTPYVDFFFAHPPLQVYSYAAVFKFFGFNLGILKFLSAAAAVIAAFFVFLVLNERSDFAAIFGTLLFFFTHATMLFTGFPTGTEFAMMFSAAGFYFFYKKTGLVSGILFGLGALAGLLALVPAVICAIWLLPRDFDEFKRFVAGFAAVFGVVSLVFIIVSKGSYIAQVFAYNLLKPSGVIDTGAVLSRMLYKNWLLLAAAATVVFAGWKPRFSVLVPATIVGAYAAAFVSMKAVFDYYSLAAVPFLAILAGEGLVGAVELSRLRKVYAYGAIFAVIAAFGFANYFGSGGNGAYDFEDAREVASFVRDNSAANETVFGEDATAPLISLLSGREIALNFVDSNDLRFRSGLEDPDDVVRQLKESDLRFFLVRKLDFGNNVKMAYGVATLNQFSNFLNEDCEVARKFETPWNGMVKEYYVYDCG